MEDNNQFLQQFGGSATANLVTAIGFMIYKFIEGRCKHSKCSSNTSCFKCSADNYTERAASNKTIRDGVRPQESMQKLQRRDNKILQEKHIAVEKLELRDPESISTGNSVVVKGETIV